MTSHVRTRNDVVTHARRGNRYCEIMGTLSSCVSVARTLRANGRVCPVIVHIIGVSDVCKSELHKLQLWSRP